MVSRAQSKPVGGPGQCHELCPAQVSACQHWVPAWVGLLCVGTFPAQSTTIRPKKAVRKDSHLPALRLMQVWV